MESTIINRTKERDEKMKFKVGDKVRVRGDLKNRERYHMASKKISEVAMGPMVDLKGQIVTISGITSSGMYTVKECLLLGASIRYRWTDEMFEPVAETCDKKIVITADGMKTIARLYEGEELIKTATAKCSPDDTFDFALGSNIAFIRLFVEGETKAAKPRIEVGKYYRYVDEIRPFAGIIKIIGKEGREYFYDVVDGMKDDIVWHCFYEGSLFESFLTPIDYKPEPRYYSGKVVCTHRGTDDGYTVGKIYEFVNGTVVDDDGDVRYKFNPVFNISELQLVRFIPLVE